MIPNTIEELMERLEYIGQIYSEGEQTEIWQNKKWRPHRIKNLDFLYDNEKHIVIGNNMYKIKPLIQLTLF